MLKRLAPLGKPREKPNRSKANKTERVELGKVLAARPASFYREKSAVDEKRKAQCILKTS